MSEQRTWIGVHEKSRGKENSEMVLGDHVEVLRQGTVSDKARTLLNADHMPRAIEVRSQQARIRTSCKSRIPRDDRKLVSLTQVALIRTKSKPTRTPKRLIQEIGSRFPICVKVRKESSVPACRERLLGAPSIHPVPVIFAIASKDVVNAEPQRAVDGAEATERTVSIRDWGKLKAWWQASWRGRHPLIWWWRWLRAS